MTKVSAAKELMEAAGVMAIIASVGAFLSLSVWVWVCVLWWAKMPIGEVVLYTWVAIWSIGMVYCILDLMERSTEVRGGVPRS